MQAHSTLSGVNMKLITLINPSANVAELAAIADNEDLLLLRQDAVYLALQDKLPFPGGILALESDVNWRNIRLNTAVQVISDAEWVTLSAEATQCILWS